MKTKVGIGFTHRQSCAAATIGLLYRRRFIAVAAMSAFAFGATEVATAAVSARPQTIGNLYSPLTPSAVATELQNDQAAGQDNQTSMNQIGAHVVNSIPGFSIDFKQSATQLSTTPNTVKEDFACGNSSSGQSYPDIQEVNLYEGNKASITFCSSDNKVDILSTDINSPVFSNAFDKTYTSDPRRSELWGGDDYEKNLYLECNSSPFQSQSKLKATYSRKTKTIKAAFYGMPVTDYCDELGQYTQTVSAQVRKPGQRRYKQVGESVVHVVGLREILGYNSDIANRYVRVNTKIPNAMVNCEKSSKGTKVRLSMVEKFQAMKGQQFAHSPTGDGSSTNVQGAQRTISTHGRKVCK